MAVSPAPIKIQIIDYADLSGAAYITNFCTEGTLNGFIQSDFYIKYPNSTARYETPVVLRGIGKSGLENHIDALSNPSLYYTINGNTGYNEDWKSGPYANVISGRHLQPSGDLESADLVRPFLNLQTAYLYSTNQTPAVARGRLDIIRLTGSGAALPSQMFSGSGTSAWISYDVRTGFSNKNIFSYAISLVNQISGDSNKELLNKQTNKPTQLIYQSGLSYNDYCNDISLILDQTGITCQLSPSFDEDEPLQICISTGLSGTVQNTISSILDELTTFQSQIGEINSHLVNDSQVQVNSNSLAYSRYQTLLQYNQPLSGDYICFESYNYNYTGIYSGQYNVAPPYPTIKKCWYYGIDYSGISGLVNVINNDLLNVRSYNLWIRELGCVDQSISGYFETGFLARATQSGDNYIYIDSLRDGAAGKYAWTFGTGIRPSTYPYFDISKYMMPNKVSLQGATGDNLSWVDINIKDNLNWDVIKPIKIVTDYNQNITGQSLAQTIANSPIGISGEITKTLIYKATITGTNKCGAPFSQEVDFYATPSGLSCQDADNDPFKTSNNNQVSGFNNPNKIQVEYSILKTGWNFTNTGNYNYYRILFDKLTVNALNQNVNLDNSLYVDSVQFYVVQPSSINHSGQMCLFGANYTGYIQGLTTGLLTGIITGQPNSQGIKCFNFEVVTGVPNGGFVNFNHSSGMTVTNFTGLVDACVTGTGFFTESVIGFYYNSGNQCIQYSKPISGLISGSGNLTGGPYNIILNSTMAKLTGSQFVQGSGLALHSGLIYNFVYNFNNQPAFGSISGNYNLTLTNTDKGEKDINVLLYGLPSVIYSQAISGTKQATSILSYNTPNFNDTIFINNFPIIYDSGTGFLSPTYFHNINELNNIINSGAQFQTTGYNDGTNIYLTSLLLGESGNSITTRTSGSVTKPSFSSTTLGGGVNYHFLLNSINFFSGYLTTGFQGTGYFIATGTGSVTGTIKQLDFIRYFTGIWNLQTGDTDFRANNYIVDNNKYQNSGFVFLTNYTGNPDVIPHTVYYTNDPLVVSTDLARFTVSGFGAATGISMIISGVY